MKMKKIKRFDNLLRHRASTSVGRYETGVAVLTTISRTMLELKKAVRSISKLESRESCKNAFSELRSKPQLAECVFNIHKYINTKVLATQF